MKYDQGVGAYAKTQVTTTTNQQELIVLAYDGILKFLNQAKAHIAAQDIEPAHLALTKARSIIEELAGTLNMNAGGEIARNLWTLYLFFMQKITEANFTKDVSHIDAIMPALVELKEAWASLELSKEDEKANAINRRIPAADSSHRLSISG